MQCYLSGHSDGSIDSVYGDEDHGDDHHHDEDGDLPAGGQSMICPSDSKDSGLGGRDPTKPSRDEFGGKGEEGEDQEEEEELEVVLEGEGEGVMYREEGMY